jgi:hypothetical protein
MSLTKNAELWLATGERCTASETIFTFATGVDALSDWGPGFPTNLEEFRRCRLLLEQCPELRSCLPRVANASREWAEIVNFWDDICVLQDVEDPSWREHAGKAPQARAMLAHIIGRVAE